MRRRARTQIDERGERRAHGLVEPFVVAGQHLPMQLGEREAPRISAVDGAVAWCEDGPIERDACLVDERGVEEHDLRLGGTHARVLDADLAWHLHADRARDARPARAPARPVRAALEVQHSAVVLGDGAHQRSARGAGDDDAGKWSPDDELSEALMLAWKTHAPSLALEILPSSSNRFRDARGTFGA